MIHKSLYLFVLVLGVSACRSNPNKAEKIETKMEQSGKVSGNEQVGVKKGEMVVQSKVVMAEKLRDLQNGVFSLEDRVYGTRKLGSLGMYGELKTCRRKLASRQYGGSGTLVWTEPLDRVTDKEDELKLGLDEKQELVGVSEEYLRDRLQRFGGYKQILQKRADEYQDRIEECKTDLGKREVDNDQPSKVTVQEAPKATADRAAINQYMCGFVKPGASLEALMLNAFAKGWLSLSDFKLTQNMLAANLKDAKGVSMDNGLLFNGWKLAFDAPQVTVGELLQEGKDAKLVAWTYGKRDEVPGSGSCLGNPDGVWNP